MEHAIQAVLDGAANGTVYGALALAIVLIFRTTGNVNVAQGEMAMFSTFVAWALVQAGLPLGAAVAATLAISFGGGMAIERVLIRPFEGREPMTLLTVTVGLFLTLNAAAGWLWGFETRSFPSTLPQQTIELGGVRLSLESLAMIAVLAGVAGVLFALFQRTTLGVAMRAVAENPPSSRLVGIRVGRMQMLGWGLAALLGALAGILAAPHLFLDVNFMVGVLLYAFGAAAIGGFDSGRGAILGGWIVGVSETLAASYLGFIGGDLKVLVPLVIVFAVLLVRPRGLFGSPEALRA